MEFLQIDNQWTYPLTEWNGYEREDVEEALEEMGTIFIKEYTMAPSSDVWIVEYKKRDFAIVKDFSYGCEIRAFDRDDLSQFEKLIKSFKL